MDTGTGMIDDLWFDIEFPKKGNAHAIRICPICKKKFHYRVVFNPENWMLKEKVRRA